MFDVLQVEVCLWFTIVFAMLFKKSHPAPARRGRRARPPSSSSRKHALPRKNTMTRAWDTCACFFSVRKKDVQSVARAFHAIAVSFAAALFLLFFFFTFFVTVFFLDFFGAAADRTAVACTGKPSANRRV